MLTVINASMSLPQKMPNNRGWDILQLTMGLRAFSNSNIQDQRTQFTVLLVHTKATLWVEFSSPLQCNRYSIRLQTHSQISSYVFAQIIQFLGPNSQVLEAEDLFHTLLAEANLALDAIDSNILLNNLQPTLLIPTTMTTKNSLEFPSTTEGIKLLGAPLGKAIFCQELF